MWAMGNWNLPYVGQDTNTTIKSYHTNLKAILRATQSHDFIKDMWIGGFTSYWGMFCPTVGIRVWEGIKGCSHYFSGGENQSFKHVSKKFASSQFSNL